MSQKMKNQQFVSLTQQCSSTQDSSGQGFLSKEQGNNTGKSPIPFSTDSSSLLPVPSTEISIEEMALL